ALRFHAACLVLNHRSNLLLLIVTEVQLLEASALSHFAAAAHSTPSPARAWLLRPGDLSIRRLSIRLGLLGKRHGNKDRQTRQHQNYFSACGHFITPWRF